jgi:hypothetical protein
LKKNKKRKRKIKHRKASKEKQKEKRKEKAGQEPPRRFSKPGKTKIGPSSKLGLV